MKVLYAEGGSPGAAASCVRFFEKMEAKHPKLFEQMPRVRLEKAPEQRPYRPRAFTGETIGDKVEERVIKLYLAHKSMRLAAHRAGCSESTVARILERRGIRERGQGRARK